MNQFNTKLKVVVLAAAMSALSTQSAWAIRDGIAVDSNSVITNPFNPNQTVEAWKLVGYGDCSGIRISKEWVMSTGHCGFGVTGTFRSEQGTAPVDLSTCTDSAAIFGYKSQTLTNDLHICRLANQGTLTEPATYPVLAVMPQFDFNNANKYGALLMRGMARVSDTAPLQVALVDFNGMPLGFEATTVDTTKPTPSTIGGDSGGGAYWLPPNGQAPALVGVLHVSGSAKSPWYFTSDNLTKLNDYIVTRGQATDQKPTIKLTPDAYYQAPSANPAPMMTSAPIVSTTSGLGSALTISWTPPTGSTTIDSFKVTLGLGSALKQTLSVANGLGNNVKLVGLEISPSYRVCVTPVNAAGGAATSAYAYGGTPVLPGCTSVDNRTPSVTPVPATPASRQLSSTTYAISTTWPAVTSDVPLRGYRVLTTTTLASGPKRTTTQDVTATSVSTTTTAGATVCFSVAAVSKIGMLGSYSAAQCKTAR